MPVFSSTLTNCPQSTVPLFSQSKYLNILTRVSSSVIFESHRYLSFSLKSFSNLQLCQWLHPAQSYFCLNTCIVKLISNRIKLCTKEKREASFRYHYQSLYAFFIINAKYKSSSMLQLTLLQYSSHSFMSMWRSLLFSPWLKQKCASNVSKKSQRIWSSLLLPANTSGCYKAL